jgi:ParB family chromosome partitioning protein
VLGGLAETDDSPRFIRRALTEHDIAGTDKRARFVTVTAYEEAGGPVRRDLFTEGDSGVFLLDSQLLDRLAREKLEAAAEAVRAEGWKWVEIRLEFGYEDLSGFVSFDPEPLPLSEEAQAEQKRLSEEYQTLFEANDDPDEQTSERLDAIQARMKELDNTGEEFLPETFAIAGAIVAIGRDGEAEVTRGLARPEDVPCKPCRPKRGLQ